MLGPLLLLAFLAVAFPVGFLMSNAVIAALFSKLHTDDAEARAAASPAGAELIELSKR